MSATPAKARAPISSKLARTPINHFMSRKVVYASPSTSVKNAMQMMLTHKISGLVVVDDTNTCLGVYSELDAVIQGAGSDTLEVAIRYTKPALIVRPDAPFHDVLVLMVQKKVKRLIVVDSRKKLMGIVSRHDLMKALFNDLKNHAPEGV